MYLFKLDIISLFSFFGSHVRNAKVDAFGLKAELNLAQEQQQSASINEVDKPFEESPATLPQAAKTPAVANREREIREYIKNDKDPTDQLVNSLAVAQLSAGFAIVYAVIFGSQITVLKELTARRHMAVDEAVVFYSEIAKKNSGFYDTYGFAGWLGFLRAHNLVLQTGEKQTVIEITDIGDDFLRWLESSKLPANRLW